MVTLNMLRRHEDIFRGLNSPICDHALALNQCLKRIKLNKLARTCAPIAGLPSDVLGAQELTANLYCNSRIL